jgi:hypothetical protein
VIRRLSYWSRIMLKIERKNVQILKGWKTKYLNSNEILNLDWVGIAPKSKFCAKQFKVEKVLIETVIWITNVVWI